MVLKENEVREMKVLVTGSRGYIGAILCYELVKRGHEVIGIDNNSRNEWVERCGGKINYNIPIEQHGIYGDVANLDFLREIFQIHQPDIVIHLASQPSMPYSQLNAERALFTQVNNLSMCVNLLWLIKEQAPRPKLIITTTTGIPGQALQAIPEEPTLNKAGSWYHISRGFDSENCQLANRQWGLDILELRTAIVYGCGETRFDTDFYFGTALNRFIDQAVKGQPLTIYGKGEQTKPFVSLNDTVQSLANAIDYEFKGYEVMNQTTQDCAIVDIARAIQQVIPSTKIVHIPNPRQENEEHQMIFDNRKFLKLLNKTPDKIEDEIPRMVEWVKRR